MKINFDDKYLKYSLYTIFTFASIFLIYFIGSNIKLIFGYILNVVDIFYTSLKPLLIALLITYILHPLVEWYDGKVFSKVKFLKGKRTISVVSTYLTVLAFIFGLIFMGYVLISGQFKSGLKFSTMYNKIVENASKIESVFDNAEIKVNNADLSEGIREQINVVINSMNEWITSFFSGFFVSLAKITNDMIKLLMSIVISFYLLKDRKYFLGLYEKVTDKFVPSEIKNKAHNAVKDIDNVVSNFIRGQLLDAFIVGVISIITLMLIGLPYAVAIGAIVGITNIIPYFGPFIGAVPAVIAGITSPNPMTALYAVIALIVIQNVDGNFIAPKVIGNSVGVHPVFIMMAIIIAGTYFGLLGMFVAVPFIGVLKVFITRWFNDETRGEIK